MCSFVHDFCANKRLLEVSPSPATMQLTIWATTTFFAWRGFPAAAWSDGDGDTGGSGSGSGLVRVVIAPSGGRWGRQSQSQKLLSLRRRSLKEGRKREGGEISES